MIVDDLLEEDEGEGWVEITRSEALNRLETMLTVDLVAFEIEHTSDPTPVGPVETYTWFKLDELGEQIALFLCVRDPGNPGRAVRWFIHPDLLEDLVVGTR